MLRALENIFKLIERFFELTTYSAIILAIILSLISYVRFLL